MKEKLLMGNEAIGLGALHAGVGFVFGYPGTPSTEILETVAKNKGEGVYVEWSVNEKAAIEAAAGAAYAGARSMVTMKQVGLNVASDPLMSLTYVGVKGGMVVVVADDPGPISSQTEQDTRHFAEFAKLPVFDPSSPEEAYQMIGDAFALSEQLGTPVLFRPTTRVCHGCVSLQMEDCSKRITPEGFIKDASRWVIFPRLTYQNHQKIEARNEKLRETFSTYRFNFLEGAGRKGIATGGISYEGSAAVVGAGAETFKGGHAASLPRGAGAFLFRWVGGSIGSGRTGSCDRTGIDLSVWKTSFECNHKGEVDRGYAKCRGVIGRNRQGSDSPLSGSARIFGSFFERPPDPSGSAAGALCRLSAPRLILCGQAGYEGEKGCFFR